MGFSIQLIYMLNLHEIMGFEHVTSSPHCPQKNGEAERAVKTVEGFLRKSGDPYLAILAYRSTSLECGYSPAQLLMSRNLRTTLPVIRDQKAPKVVNLSRLQEKEGNIKERQRQNYNRRHKAQELPQLESGDTVWIPDRDSSGTVVEEASPHSHIVDTPDGSYCRNWRHLVRMPSPEPSRNPEQSGPAEGRITRSSSGRLPQPPSRLNPSWS